MNKPLLLLVVGGCGLLFAGVVVKRYRSANDAPPAQVPLVAVAPRERPGEERSGWRPSAEGAARAAAARARGARPFGDVEGQTEEPKLPVRGKETSRTTMKAPSGRGAVPESAQGPSARHRFASEPGDADGPRGPGRKLDRGNPGAMYEDVVVDDAAEGADTGGPVLSFFDGDQRRDARMEAVIDKNVDHVSEGGHFNEESELAVAVTGKLPDDHGSISFWVRPDGTTDRASLAQLRSRYVYENRLQLWQDKGSIRLVFADSTGTESNLSYESDSWEPGEWRMVTVTWGDGQNALYINGDLAGASQYDGNFKILPDTLLHVASNYVEDSPSLEGSVNRFHVYDRPLTPEEVAAELSNYPE